MSNSDTFLFIFYLYPSICPHCLGAHNINLTTNGHFTLFMLVANRNLSDKHRDQYKKLLKKSGHQKYTNVSSHVYHAIHFHFLALIFDLVGLVGVFNLALSKLAFFPSKKINIEIFYLGKFSTKVVKKNKRAILFVFFLKIYINTCAMI